jgi:hypothetical protein
MYFVALATDYDGTLAEVGLVAEETIAALRSFRQSGRTLILVTGRELPDLRRGFPHLELFDAAVVENRRARGSKNRRTPLYQARIMSGLGIDIIDRGSSDRDDVAEKLLDRGLPAEALGPRAADLSTNVQRCQGGSPEIPIENSGAAVADDVHGPRDRQCRDRNPAGQRFEHHQPECLGAARQYEHVSRCVVLDQRFAL